MGVLMKGRILWYQQFNTRTRNGTFHTQNMTLDIDAYLSIYFEKQDIDNRRRQYHFGQL